MVCELCFQTADARSAELISAQDMRDAVAAGYMRAAIPGMIPDDDREREEWRAHVNAREDDWELCSRCFRTVSGFLSSGPSPRQNLSEYRKEAARDDRDEEKAQSTRRTGRAMVFGVLTVVVGISLLVRGDAWIALIVFVGGGLGTLAAFRGQGS